MAHGVVFQSVAEAVITDVAEPPPMPLPPGFPGREVKFPSEDGKPMVENNFQAVTMRHASSVLSLHFEGRGYVAIDVIVYYDENDAGKSVVPDVLVVLGADGSLRDTYKVWEEGSGVPDFVLEVVANSTQGRDAGDKRKTYAEMGVREYFRFAPRSSNMASMNGHRLVGETLEEGHWDPLPRIGEERILSEVLGLELRVRDQYAEGTFRELRFHDPDTDQDLPTRKEDRQGRLTAERDREIEWQARKAAEHHREVARRARKAAERDRDAAERDREIERQGRLEAERRIAELVAKLENQSRS
ncbi:MAG: Uma2 family endonuclease [Bryobacterales bacterium]|nr:Uma2 family endonuclease [Bryobacterales bacterium]